ncbi:1,4-dihydroxy-2-naphthoate octaprenyltransferase [Psychroflexus aestuariivivens]|uniref:1,4-dihydroxy-2-naphthoate octaprenyltransferase n=1 Tax=Psychroflexus aestuariivivens TaxID=1795040 RepID=UPI000FDCB941|nr:1,4-dihydroxy-2-naphthoate octaprenyltransferase [Psychroflexus aestuariivivens]
MKKITAWISAARLRTLPLSISGILTGSATALLSNNFNSSIFFLALATTLGLQILSNFANDYGDGVKGTDNDERLGPVRALQSGAITDKEMKVGMIITSIITLILAICLIYISFGKNEFLYSLLFLALGIASILAAIKYTVGNSAYGYRGLGDIFVFVFFGLVSVIGVNFLMTKTIDFWLILPATSIGLLSSAVLNLNNMRDENSDRNSQKNTLVVKFGKSFAKTYHFSLIIVSFFSLLAYQIQYFGFNNWIVYLPFTGFIILFIHLKKVYNYQNPRHLDPELKKVALSTFLISLLLFLVYYFN